MCALHEYNPGQLWASQQYCGGSDHLTLGYRSVKGLSPLRFFLKGQEAESLTRNVFERERAS